MSEFLRRSGVKTWLDTKNKSVGQARVRNDRPALASEIVAGIRGSSHLLALIGPDHTESSWIPFEIGAAMGASIPCGLLLHERIDPKKLPEYFDLAEVIDGTRALRAWLEPIQKSTTERAMRVASAEVLRGFVRIDEPRLMLSPDQLRKSPRR